MIEKIIEFIFSSFGFILNFVFIPLYVIAQLFVVKEQPNLYVMFFFVLSIFFTSLFNIFKEHHKYHLWPQFLKMILAIFVAIMTFATIYRFGGLISPSGEISNNPHDALYFSLVTWTTLGFGDFQPSDAVRYWAGIEAILGTLFTPLLLAAIIFSADLSKSTNEN